MRYWFITNLSARLSLKLAHTGILHSAFYMYSYNLTTIQLYDSFPNFHVNAQYLLIFHMLIGKDLQMDLGLQASECDFQYCNEDSPVKDGANLPFC